MLKLLLSYSVLFLSFSTFSQENLGEVKIQVKPENAQIVLEDSLLNSGKIYTWPQGVYKLQISAMDYDTLRISYLQVYKDKLNSYEFKLKKYKEPKLIKTIELLSPVILVPAAYIITNFIFPVKSLNSSIENVEAQRNFAQLAKEKLEQNSWQNNIEISQAQFNDSKVKYEQAVKDHNDLVKKNNLNRIVRPIILGTVAAANFYYIYRAYQKRKKSDPKLSVYCSPNYLSLSMRF